MKFFFLAFFAIKASNAQVTFENQLGFLDSINQNYFKGYQGIASDYTFSDGSAHFTSSHDTSAWGDYWSGWAISRLKDSVSLSYDTSDCASFPAVGANGSNIYAVAFFNSFDTHYNLIRFSSPQFISKISITNTTIAYRSMQNGDGFAKKFGGVTGNDPDFFCVTFYGWRQGNLTDSVTAYLADFRDSNNVNDYILNTWKDVDLSPIGVVDSMSYFLSSSDTSAFGINTPTYFCIDNLYYAPTQITQQELNSDLMIYPNPFQAELNIKNNEKENLLVSIFGIHGNQISSFKILKNENYKLDTQKWASGFYFLQIQSKNENIIYKIVK